MKRIAGFSLLELMAVLSIFALVALIGVQVLQSSVRSSERLTEISDASSDLAYGLAVLRHDLNAALPREFASQNGGLEAALAPRNGGFSLSVGGLARMETGATGFGRVNWRFDPGSRQVFRQVWTSLDSAAGSKAPEIAVLKNVEAFEFSTYRPIAGWRPGFAGDPRDLGQLPIGIKVYLTHARAGDLETIVSLR